jgi:hypothetical protein
MVDKVVDKVVERPTVVVNQTSEAMQNAVETLADKVESITDTTNTTVLDAVTLDTLNTRLTELGQSLTVTIDSLKSTHDATIAALSQKVDEWTTKFPQPPLPISPQQMPLSMPESLPTMNQTSNEHGGTISEVNLENATKEPTMKKKRNPFYNLTKIKAIR